MTCEIKTIQQDISKGQVSRSKLQWSSIRFFSTERNGSKDKDAVKCRLTPVASIQLI